MTEFWKSHGHYWCDVCKVWMLDKVAIRQIHEKGIKHQENVAKKLRAMRQGAEAQKREEAQTEAVLKSVEQQAAEQYARDKASAAEELAAINGTWEPDEGTAYLYNKAQRYYYDKASSMYYGGDPPEWSAEPAILAAARYAAVPAAAASKPTSAARQQPAAAKARPPRQAVSSHVGGYQMPMTGVIGGLAGVGGAASVAQSQPAGSKRPREPAGSGKAASKAVSSEEAAAQARREAARARVQQRTMQQFGLG